MKAILHLIKNRRLECWSPLPAIQIGHRNILLSDVVRYFRRRGIKNPEESVRELVASSVEHAGHSPSALGPASYQELLSRVGTSHPDKPSAQVLPILDIRTQWKQSCCYPSDLPMSCSPPPPVNYPLSTATEEVMAHALIERTQHYSASWLDRIRSVDMANTILEPSFPRKIAQRLQTVMMMQRRGEDEDAFEILSDISDGLSFAATAVDPTALVLMHTLVIYSEQGDTQPVAKGLSLYLKTRAQNAHHTTEQSSQIGTYGLPEIASRVRSQLICTTLCNICEVMKRQCGGIQLRNWPYPASENAKLDATSPGGRGVEGHAEESPEVNGQLAAEYTRAFQAHVEPRILAWLLVEITLAVPQCNPVVHQAGQKLPTFQSLIRELDDWGPRRDAAI